MARSINPYRHQIEIQYYTRNLMVAYLPKYILRRMFPPDCVKKVEGGIELTMNNVISPITAKQMPDDITEFLSAKIDGEPIPAEIISGLVVTINDKQYSANNLKELDGQTLPVGGSMTFFVPYDAVQPGEEHEITLDVKSTKFQFSFSRVVQ